MIRFADSEGSPLLDIESVAVLGLDDQDDVHFSERVRCNAELPRAIARAEATPGVTYVRMDFPNERTDR